MIAYRITAMFLVVGLMFGGKMTDKLIAKADASMLKSITKKIDTNYSKLKKGKFGFGKSFHTEKLSDGSDLYLHSQTSNWGGWSLFGFFGKEKKRFNVMAFKVKNDVIVDVAYGGYVPDMSGWVLFYFIKTYKDEKAYEVIRGNYTDFVKTNSGESVSTWK